MLACLVPIIMAICGSMTVLEAAGTKQCRIDVAESAHRRRMTSTSSPVPTHLSAEFPLVGRDFRVIGRLLRDSFDDRDYG